MNKILQDLYQGHIPGKQSSHANAETATLAEKIRSERRYLASIISDEDFERFKSLESLHNAWHKQHYMDTHLHAFRTGVMLMCALFADCNMEEK